MFNKNSMMILFFMVTSLCGNFEDNWKLMQHTFYDLKQSLDPAMCADFVQDGWQTIQRQIESQIIAGEPKVDFLFRVPITGTITKSSCIRPFHKLLFLNHCLTPELRNLISKFHDTTIGGNTIQPFLYSYDGLEQLYFFSKIMSMCMNTKNISVIVELGGGYGCLARIAKTVLPDITYIILDLPESLAIQSLFLSLSMPDNQIIVHKTMPKSFEFSSIHLVPIHFVDGVELKADAFISNFALSETTYALQKKIIDKKFFNAEICFLTGQLNITPHHSFVMNNLRKLFEYTTVDLYHGYHIYVSDSNLADYQIMAWKD